MKKPRLADLGAALTEGFVAAVIAFVVIAAVAHVAPGMIGSRRAAIDAVILVACGVFVSRLASGRGPEWFGAEAGVSLPWSLLALLAALLAFVGTLAFFDIFIFPSRYLFRVVSAALAAILAGCGVFFFSQLVFTRRWPEWSYASLRRALLTAFPAALVAFVVIMAVPGLGLSPYSVAVLVFILTLFGVYVGRLVHTRRRSK